MTSPIICWIRRDFRLSDNPMLATAAESGRPVVPVFILDEVMGGYGACPRWRMGLGAEAFATALAGIGSRLTFRKGNALEVLRGLVKETGASAVWWARNYDPDAVARDTAVKAALKADGLEAKSFPGHVMFEPWSVETKTGAFYKVYTPYWKMVKDRDVPAPRPSITALKAPDSWPESDDPATWKLEAAMNRGADVVRPWLNIGEDAAAGRLGAFIASRVAEYDSARDLPAVQGTSRLSENLTYGEISPRTCWHAGMRALNEGKAGAETFLKEIVWREFAHHLVYHTPRITSGNWREEWDAFTWETDESTREVAAWRQGRTGIRFVDAAMRELYVTGHMHNRARMIVASYLTKHLMCHWKIGLDWFADCLADWDPASNAMGWQWSAGSGPDATPYFRVFNPVTQLDKFDKNRAYVDTWIAEGKSNPSKQALRFFDAIPRTWSISANDPYPEPLVTAEDGRKRALAAYEARDF
ncbi:MAG: deoxyribodipyrimidine photo-lyase [Pseudomonadota bacterium]